MIIFDLREEARLVSYLYLVGGLALACGAAIAAPRRLRNLLPPTLSAALRPLATIFALVTAGLAWIEYDERREAEALVAQCLSGGCTLAEGLAWNVTPVHQVTSGSRMTAPIRGGYFNVGDSFFAHYPRDSSDYSPANRLRDGDRVRVLSRDGILVLVEVME